MDAMTSSELNQYLENIAKLIEATAKTPEEAAKIVRDSKVKAKKKKSSDPPQEHRYCTIKVGR